MVEKNNTATAIRKLYTNIQGIEFSAMVDASHIHIDLDSFLPYLINNVSDNNDNYIEKTHKFPNVIGMSECVRKNELDNIIFGKRKKRIFKIFFKSRTGGLQEHLCCF